MTIYMKKVPEKDRIEELFLSGLDENKMPGIERCLVYKVHITKGVEYTAHTGEQASTATNRIIYELCQKPKLTPLNGHKALSRDPYKPFGSYRGFKPLLMLFKNSISTGRRKASFHKTREQAEQRLREWIQVRLTRSTKEYKYCTAYMKQLNKVVHEAIDIGDERRKEELGKLIDQPKRRMSI